MSWTTRWEIKTVSVRPTNDGDLAYLDAILRELWEPYSVTWDGNVFDCHLRRLMTTKDRKGKEE